MLLGLWILLLAILPLVASGQEGVATAESAMPRAFQSAGVLAAGITYNSPSAGGDTSWYNADPGAVIDIDFHSTLTAGLDVAQYRVAGGSWQTVFTYTCPSFVGDYTTTWTVDWSLLAEGANEVDLRVRECGGGWVTHTYTSGVSGFRFLRDTAAPTSGADSPQYDNAGTIPVTWTAQARIEDLLSPLAYTRLWVRYQGGGWVTTTLTETGTAGVFDFSPTDGDGTYFFATQALDVAGNAEAGPTGEGDTQTIYDTVVPTSTAHSPDFSPPGKAIAVTWKAGDTTSGVASTGLWVRHETTTTWTSSGLVQTGTVGTFAFIPPQQGTYYFQTIATDNAGNVEAGPAGNGDTWTTVRNIFVYLPLVMRAYTPPAPDLSTSLKRAEPAAVNAGEVLTYTIVLTNSGSRDANVTLTDPIPAQTAFMAGSAEGCTYDAGQNQIGWNGPLGAGQSHTCRFSVVVDVAAGGTIVNSATAYDGYHLSPVTLPPTETPVMVTNGGFEAGTVVGWQVSGDAVLPPPQVSDVGPHNGNYDLLLGGADYCLTPKPWRSGNHSSIATQTIYVPVVSGTPMLRFWYRILTYDHLIWTDGRLGDSLDLYVGGALALRDNYQNLPDPAPGCDSLQDSGWREPTTAWGGQVDPLVLDLSEWKGQWVELRFELWTRWDGYYNTWAYIDDVRVSLER